MGLNLLLPIEFRYKKALPGLGGAYKQYGMYLPKAACCIQTEHPKNPWTLRVFCFCIDVIAFCSRTSGIRLFRSA